MDEAREIPLTQGKVAVVDAADYGWLSQWKWQAQLAQHTGTWYAVRAGSRASKSKSSQIRMHRVIMNAPSRVEVDHRDRDGLNNRRMNLRLSTRSQNIFNSKTNSRNKSGFRGVCFYKKWRKYVATIAINGKNQYLGGFNTPEEAARAYDAKAREIAGEFARLNFP